MQICISDCEQFIERRTLPRLRALDEVHKIPVPRRHADERTST
jgi:hypothetical protein